MEGSSQLTLSTANVHPHAITAECPVGCLAGVLPARALTPLARELRRGPESGTVADVAGLYRDQRLAQIRNLGVKGIAEIEAVLIAAGLVIPDATASGGNCAGPTPAGHFNGRGEFGA